MTTQTANYMDAIAHLPAGGSLILNDVPWEEYEELLSDLGEGYAVRIAYDRGRLEIMSPTARHGMYRDLLLRLVDSLAETNEVVLETRGSTTFKEKQLLQGAEPDTCFYVENAKRIIGKGNIDLAKDPPPDIIVEVDVSHQSTGKLSFYSAIGVPEIWRYDERQVRILHLIEGRYVDRYVEMPSSLTFPVLTDKVLTAALEQSKTEGQSAALRTFRQWLKEI